MHGAFDSLFVLAVIAPTVILLVGIALLGAGVVSVRGAGVPARPAAAAGTRGI